MWNSWVESCSRVYKKHEDPISSCRMHIDKSIELHLIYTQNNPPVFGVLTSFGTMYVAFVENNWFHYKINRSIKLSINKSFLCANALLWQSCTNSLPESELWSLWKMLLIGLVVRVSEIKSSNTKARALSVSSIATWVYAAQSYSFASVYRNVLRKVYMSTSRIRVTGSFLTPSWPQFIVLREEWD